MDVVRVSPPPVPVMVTLVGPGPAVVEAVKVTTLLAPVAEAGLKVAVTPEGRPLALRATADVKLVRAMPIVLVAAAPCVTDRAGGLAPRVKFCEGFTVRAIGSVWVSPPPAPVIVTLAGPAGAVAEAVKVTTLPAPVTDGGLKLAVTPEGRPLALSATALANPAIRVMPIVL